MGDSVKARLRRGDERVDGVALLESGELIFRGAERLVIRLGDCKSAAVRGGELLLTLPDGPVAFELGADVARKWLEKIKNPKSLVQKLGVKLGQRVALVGLDGDPLVEQLRAAGIAIDAGKPKKGSDVIFAAVTTRKDLTRLPALKSCLAPDGALWIIRLKGNAEAGESDVRAAAHAAGLVDVKVVRVSETQTGDKFVIPVAARQR